MSDNEMENSRALPPMAVDQLYRDCISDHLKVKELEGRLKRLENIVCWSMGMGGDFAEVVKQAGEVNSK